MPSDNDEQPLRKGYLILLGIAVVVMLALNPGVLRGILPRRSPAKRPPVAPGRPAASDASRSGGTREHGSMASIRRDVEAFNAWFMDEQNTPAADIVMVSASTFYIARLDPNPTHAATVRYRLEHHCQRGGLSGDALLGRLSLLADNGVTSEIQRVEPLPGGTNFTVSVRVSGVGRVGLAVDALPPVFYDVNIRSLWPVGIRGTVHDKEAGWVALFGQSALHPGSVLPPDDSYCGYRVLSVSRRCVWLAAFADALSEDGLPPLRWPDLERIVMSPNLEPVKVELRPGAFLAPGDSIDFKHTRARMTVDRLWPKAVHFRYQPAGSGDVLDLLCVIVQ